MGGIYGGGGFFCASTEVSAAIREMHLLITASPRSLRCAYTETGGSEGEQQVATFNFLVNSDAAATLTLVMR